MEKYSCSPLNAECEEIRLVHLFPGKRGSPCWCALSHASTQNENLQYTALSYTWGSLSNPKTITVEENSESQHNLPVTENLHTALQHIRDEKETRIFWIDAICIDQANIPERNNQVRGMQKIYERASKVLVWLGEASEDSDLAMMQIKKLSEVEWSGISVWDEYTPDVIERFFERP